MLTVAAKVLLKIAVTLYSAFFIKTLWWWFVVPLGVRPIHYAQAVGLDVLVTYLTSGYADVRFLLIDRKSADDGGADPAPFVEGQVLVVCMVTVMFLFAWPAEWLMLRGY